MTDPRLLAEFTARTGRIICQICCADFDRSEMEPVDDSGEVWDICRRCAPAAGLASPDVTTEGRDA